MGNQFFRITSGFDAMDTPLRTKPHTGIDLAMREGTPLTNLTEGCVKQVFNAATNTRTGNGIKIQNVDGTETVYAHLSEVGVKVGECYNVGDIIGKTGNTGNSSGPHLHLGLKQNGEWIDPSRLVDILQELSHKLLDPSWSTLQSAFGIIIKNSF